MLFARRSGAAMQRGMAKPSGVGELPALSDLGVRPREIRFTACPGVPYPVRRIRRAVSFPVPPRRRLGSCGTAKPLLVMLGLPGLEHDMAEVSPRELGARELVSLELVSREVRTMLSWAVCAICVLGSMKGGLPACRMGDCPGEGITFGGFSREHAALGRGVLTGYEGQLVTEPPAFSGGESRGVPISQGVPYRGVAFFTACVRDCGVFSRILVIRSYSIWSSAAGCALCVFACWKHCRASGYCCC